VIGTSSEARGTVYVGRRKKEPGSASGDRVYAGALDSARDTKSLRGNEYPAKVTKSFLAPTRSGRRPRQVCPPACGSLNQNMAAMLHT